MEEWYAIVRENRHPQTFQAGPAQTVPQRHINRLKDTRNALLEGRPIEGMNLSEKLIRFARSFFPEISLSVIERNQLEISNCMTDRQKDLERKDGYMTYMKLDSTVLIEDNRIHTTSVKNRVKQWYWCGVFGELYGSANETRKQGNLKIVLQYMN